MFRQMRNLRPGTTNWSDSLTTVLWRLIVLSILNTLTIIALALAVIVLLVLR